MVSFGGVDAPLAGIGDVGVGERAVGRAEPQAIGEAAPAIADLRSAEDVEQPEVDEQLTGRVAQRALDRGRRLGVVDDEGEVDVARRETAHRPRGRVATGRGQQDAEVELGPTGPSGQVVGSEHVG